MLVVVPVRLGESLQFEIVYLLPCPSPWASRQFGLVEGVDAFSECIIERISDAANWALRLSAGCDGCEQRPVGLACIKQCATR